MALKETTNSIRKLLSNIAHDLEKADGGNKAASQRVRTATVKLEKIAKLYRKESISFERKNKGVKKSAKKPAAKAKSSKPASKPAAKSVKSKAKAHKTTARPRTLAFKKPTAKIPSKSTSWLS